MSIPDKAVEAAARKHFSLQTQKLAWDELPPVMREKLRLDARGVLEAAEPYLTGEARLRESLMDLIKDRSNHSSPYPNDYVIQPNELRELLAATSEVKS